MGGQGVGGLAIFEFIYMRPENAGGLAGSGLGGRV